MNAPIAQDQLLSAARDGDAAALACLLSVTRPAVQRMALSQRSSRANAEDAIQVTLLMIYRWLGAP